MAISKRRNWILMTLGASLSLSTLISCSSKTQENVYFRGGAHPHLVTTEYLEKHYIQYKNLHQMLVSFINTLQEFLRLIQFGVNNISQNDKKILSSKEMVELFGGKDFALNKSLFRSFRKHFFRWSEVNIDGFDEKKLTQEERRPEVFESVRQMIELIGELTKDTIPNLEEFGKLSLKLEENIKKFESFFGRETKEFLEIFQFLDIVAHADQDYKKLSLSMSDPLANLNLQNFRAFEELIPNLREAREAYFGEGKPLNEESQFKTFWSVMMGNGDYLLGLLSEQKPAIFLAFLVFLFSTKVKAIQENITHLKVWLEAQKEFFNPISEEAASLYKSISQSLEPIAPKIQNQIQQASETNQKLDGVRTQMIELAKSLDKFKALMQTRDQNFEKLEISLPQGDQKRKLNLKQTLENYQNQMEAFLELMLSEREINIFTVFNEYTLLSQSYRESFNDLTKAQSNYQFLYTTAGKMFWVSRSIDEMIFKGALNLLNFWEGTEVLKTAVAGLKKFDLKIPILNNLGEIEDQLRKINVDFVKAFLPKFGRAKELEVMAIDKNLMYEKLVRESQIGISVSEISQLSFAQLEKFKSLWDNRLLPFLFKKSKPR